MALRLAQVLLFTVCAFGLGIAAPAFPVDQKCGPNAEFLTCGSACVPDCAHPEAPVMCTLQCVMGCFCKEGFLKNANGECVRLEQCEPPHHEIPMQFPQTEPKCPENEFFNPCGSACAPTCANPDPSPICTKNCVVGCFCNEGHLRDASGVCVPQTKCNAPTIGLFAYPPEISQCKENEVFLRCGTACPATCANPHPSPVCTKNCVIGCFCKPGFLKAENGVCVESETCGVPASEASPVQPHVCGDNEEFRECKGCDGTCKNPNPLCPRICVPGCACKEGHLRSDAGKCIETRECSAQVQPESFMMPVPKCEVNEEYRKCKGCDGTCKNPNPLCPRICKPGCACKEGHLRDDSGKCVETRECSTQVQPESFMMPKCEINEEYRKCKGCDGTCKNPNPLCPRSLRICKPGCACKEGHLRDDTGKCVETRECSTQVQPESFMMPPPMETCEANEEYRQCKGCDGTCQNPDPLCPRICKPGCACKKGFLRSDAGKCVDTRECATKPASFQMLPPPKCHANEMFLTCGTACPATCANPHPSPICTRNCVIGCFCKEGLLKNAQGVCVEAANC